MRPTRGVTMAVLLGALMLWSPGGRVGAQQDPGELQQLVAPIALYPDDVAADVLAAATYPAEIDAAAHWLQQNASLTPDQIAAGADRMDWDSSVKALTEFPAVLAMMDQNLAWTSALGDAYFNQPDDVMDAVQALRARAMAAGTLQSNAQIKVSTQGGIIVIEPADADTVDVPSYDCWSVFGAPIDPFPEFIFAPGLVRGPHVRWDVGVRIGGQFGRVNWGLHNWGFDWSHRRVNFHRDAFVSHSPSVVDCHYAPRVGASRGTPPGVEPRRNPGAPVIGRATERGNGEPGHAATVIPPKPIAPPKGPVDHKNDRGFPQTKPATPPAGTKAGVFTGINHGGVTSNNSSRGQSSMGAHPAAAPPHPSSPPPHPPPPPPANGRGRGRGQR